MKAAANTQTNLAELGVLFAATKGTTAQAKQCTDMDN